MRCCPNRIVGTEMVFAFPRPSSSESLSGCTDASIGNTVVASELNASDPEISSACVLAESIVEKSFCFL